MYNIQKPIVTFSLVRKTCHDDVDDDGDSKHSIFTSNRITFLGRSRLRARVVCMARAAAAREMARFLSFSFFIHHLRGTTTKSVGDDGQKIKKKKNWLLVKRLVV